MTFIEWIDKYDGFMMFCVTFALVITTIVYAIYTGMLAKKAADANQITRDANQITRDAINSEQQERNDNRVERHFFYLFEQIKDTFTFVVLDGPSIFHEIGLGISSKIHRGRDVFTITRNIIHSMEPNRIKGFNACFVQAMESLGKIVFITLKYIDSSHLSDEQKRTYSEMVCTIFNPQELGVFFYYVHDCIISGGNSSIDQKEFANLIHKYWSHCTPPPLKYDPKHSPTL